MGFRQAEVAKLLGLKNPSMISRWEQGHIMPRADYLIKLSILYKTLVNELYSELSEEYQKELFPDENTKNKSP